MGDNGRLVRCVGCGHSWHHTVDAIQPQVQSITPQAVPKDSGAIAKETRSPLKRSLGWLTFLCFLSFIVVGGYFARTSIVSAWPAAEKLYSLAGISIQKPGSGLGLENIVPLQTTKKDQSELVLKGEIINQSKEVQNIPTLNIIVRGDCTQASTLSKIMSKIKNPGKVNTCILEKWSHTLKETKLRPGEKMAFETPAKPIAVGAKDISIEF